MERKTSSRIIKIAAIVLIVLLATTVFWGFLASKRLEISEYSFTKNGLNTSFTIVHISDLHYPKNDVELDKVKQTINAARPEIVALTGDIIDGSADYADMQNISPFLAEISHKCAVFCILGNHEIGHPRLNDYIGLLNESGVVFLNNEVRTINVNGSDVAIIGLSDGKKLNVENVSDLAEKDAAKYTLLLAHRPELFENYAENSVDLVLSGHTHGGMARLFGKGLYAPNQGLFPKFSHGIYQKNGASMLVSAGLKGKDRFFNPYEISVIKISG